VVPRASLGILQMRKISHPSWDSNPRWFSLYQLLQVSHDFLQRMNVNLLWKSTVCIEQQNVLHSGSSCVIHSGNSKLIHSTNSQTVSGPDLKEEIPSYT